MMATGFMGTCCRWGQDDFWGATVITQFVLRGSLFRREHRTLLWGGYSVGNPTLNRFFSLHYLLPFVIAGVWCCTSGAACRRPEQSGPASAEDRKGTPAVPPYATIKDAVRHLLLLAAVCMGSSLQCRTISRLGQLHRRQIPA